VKSTYSVNLSANEKIVTTTSGGDDTVTVGSGGSGYIHTGDGNDVLDATDGWVDIIGTRNRNDTVATGTILTTADFDFV